MTKATIVDAYCKDYHTAILLSDDITHLISARPLAEPGQEVTYDKKVLVINEVRYALVKPLLSDIALEEFKQKNSAA